MRRASFFFPEPVLEVLRALAQKSGLSVSEHVRRAIDEYLRRHK